jgi:hypothetical protein
MQGYFCAYIRCKCQRVYWHLEVGWFPVWLVGVGFWFFGWFGWFWFWFSLVFGGRWVLVLGSWSSSRFPHLFSRIGSAAGSAGSGLVWFVVSGFGSGFALVLVGWFWVVGKGYNFAAISGLGSGSGGLGWLTKGSWFLVVLVLVRAGC